jgi:hypothetical protein
MSAQLPRLYDTGSPPVRMKTLGDCCEMRDQIEITGRKIALFRKSDGFFRTGVDTKRYSLWLKTSELIGIYKRGVDPKDIFNDMRA